MRPPSGRVNGTHNRLNDRRATLTELRIQSAWGWVFQLTYWYALGLITISEMNRLLGEGEPSA